MKLLPEQQRGLLYSKILEYVFEDIEPTDLTEEQESIWVNLKRPIDTSKAQAKNVLKRWNKDTEADTNIDTNDDTNEDTKADTQSKMSMSMSNVNVNVNKYSYEINNIIQHLNEVAGTKYKASTKTTRTKTTITAIRNARRSVSCPLFCGQWCWYCCSIPAATRCVTPALWKWTT